MMRSSMNNNSDDEDDYFAPNPFRSSGASVASNGSADFLDGPPPAPAQQQTQQQLQQQQQQPLYGQQQPQFHQPQPPYGQQQMPMQQQPDPHSGMVGSFDYPPPQQQQHHQAPPTSDPSQYLTGTMDQNAGYSNNNTNGNNNNNNNRNAPQEPASIFSIRGMSQMCCKTDQAVALFNVDSVDIYWRLKAAILQFHQPDQFRTSVIGDLAAQRAADAGQLPAEQAANVPVTDRKGPDLYGPFWLSMTLMFVLGITANLSEYLHHKRRSDPDKEFEYNINHLLHALWIVFSYSFAVPTVFWLTCQCLGMSGIPWAMWVCCYGYSMTSVLLGALVAWWLPYELWHWIVLAVAAAASGLLIVRNLSTPLLAQDAANHAKAAPVLLAILGAHVIYLLVLKLTFYP